LPEHFVLIYLRDQEQVTGRLMFYSDMIASDPHVDQVASSKGEQDEQDQ